MIARSSHRLLIRSVAAQRSLDPVLLEALILVESSDNPFAFRYEPAFYRRYLSTQPHLHPWGPLAACSYGLMQILGVVATEQGFTGTPQELFFPNTNLFYGAKYLAYLRSQCEGDLHAALAAYNGGLDGNRQLPFRNQGYLTKVLAVHAQVEGALHA